MLTTPGTGVGTVAYMSRTRPVGAPSPGLIALRQQVLGLTRIAAPGQGRRRRPGQRGTTRRAKATANTPAEIANVSGSAEGFLDPLVATAWTRGPQRVRVTPPAGRPGLRMGQNVT